MNTKTRKTEAEIDAEIAALEAIRPTVRHFTFFNDDNHAAIDAQLSVLRQRMTADELHDAFGDPTDLMGDDDSLDDDEAPFDQHALDNALEAFDWMIGDGEGVAPSESWKDAE
jgi:hypothetical protein